MIEQFQTIAKGIFSGDTIEIVPNNHQSGVWFFRGIFLGSCSWSQTVVVF